MPNCDHCGKPATCHGSYDMMPASYGCDECCGHGCEDGRCERLEDDEDERSVSPKEK